MLVSRNPDKLAAVFEEIRHPKVEICIFVLDLTREGLAAGVQALKEAIRCLDVRLLINNVGVSYPYARYFHEVYEELMRSLIRVNVEAITRVTQAVLSGMVERKCGAIVNIGFDAASVVPSDLPYSVYAATKANRHCQSHWSAPTAAKTEWHRQCRRVTTARVDDNTSSTIAGSISVCERSTGERKLRPTTESFFSGKSTTHILASLGLPLRCCSKPTPRCCRRKAKKPQLRRASCHGKCGEQSLLYRATGMP